MDYIYVSDALKSENPIHGHYQMLGGVAFDIKGLGVWTEFFLLYSKNENVDVRSLIDIMTHFYCHAVVWNRYEDSNIHIFDLI